MGIDLPLIWAVIIIFGIMMYVVMDGFDLGIGILFPFFQAKTDRDVMMNTVAPVWDGNETWLVLGGAALFGAFPLAYSVVLTALYLPLILMLIGLIFRGVAFEFRFKARDDKRHLWDKAFIGGSVARDLLPGRGAGRVHRRLPGARRPLRRRLAGLADAVHAVLRRGAGGGLCAARLHLADHEDRRQAAGAHARLARYLAFVLLAVIGIVSIWTPLAHERIAARWFTLAEPVLVPAGADSGAGDDVRLSRRCAARSTYTPFLLTLVLIFLGYSGLGISLWPNIVPPSISIWDAAAPPQSQGFMLVGTLFIIPFILGYTFWSYYVFRGKVRRGDGYH